MKLICYIKKTKLNYFLSHCTLMTDGYFERIKIHILKILLYCLPFYGLVKKISFSTHSKNQPYCYLEYYTFNKGKENIFSNRFS